MVRAAAGRAGCPGAGRARRQARARPAAGRAGLRRARPLQRAEAAFDRRFVLNQPPDEVPEVDASGADGGRVHLPARARARRSGCRRSEARRLIAQRRRAARRRAGLAGAVDIGRRAPRRRAAPGRQAPLGALATVGRPMAVHGGLLRVRTRGHGEITDLTDGVRERRARGGGRPRRGDRLRHRLDGRGHDDGVRARRRARPDRGARAPDPVRRRLRPQPPQPRHQRARAHARGDHRPLGVDPGRRRPARARAPGSRSCCSTSTTESARRGRSPSRWCRRRSRGIDRSATVRAGRQRGSQASSTGPGSAILIGPASGGYGARMRHEGESPSEEARRSLKTRQHAYVRLTPPGDVQVLNLSNGRFGVSRERKQYFPSAFAPPCVRARGRCVTDSDSVLRIAPRSSRRV